MLSPFGENHRYDFVIEINDVFYRLQCKTGRDEGTVVVFSTRSTRPRGTGYSIEGYDDDIDFFITHSWKRDQTYLVPIEAASKNEMVLRTDPPENGQSKGINWADEYTLTAQLSQIEGT